jgi:hypothetical protein
VNNTRRAASVLSLTVFCAVFYFLPEVGAKPQEGRVTAVIGNVELSFANGLVQPAAVGAAFERGTLRTAANSRAELTLGNSITVRVGADSAFVVNSDHGFSLPNGTVLIQAPKGAGAKISSDKIAVALSDGTAVFESSSNNTFKLLILEGTGRLYRPRSWGDSVLVQSGEMVFGKTNAAVSDPVAFDIGRFVDTCRLIQGFSPLRSETRIAEAQKEQQRGKSRSRLSSTNLTMVGGGTAVSVVNPNPPASAKTP